MNLHRNTRSQTVKALVRKAAWLMLAIVFLTPRGVLGGDLEEVQAAKLLSTGQVLAEKTHYLEAFDLLQEARDLLGEPNMKNAGVLSDVYFALAQAKIKARLHQGFPAHYVKTALEDVQMANRLREKLPGVLPQKLAEGYYLEGFIHKKFFMRNDVALACFRKAVNIDPGSAAAKRELSELIPGDEQKQE